MLTDPGILSPRAFIDEVVTQRLPNPFIPDTPQRIATDTSQKIPVRFGETLKSYMGLAHAGSCLAHGHTAGVGRMAAISARRGR